ncbi:MAG: MobF family relaxase [Phycisphaerales bacterium]
MLRINVSVTPGAAKRYYVSGLAGSDYYAEGFETIAEWGGTLSLPEATDAPGGVPRLGLQGTVKREQFDRLCHNLHPSSDSQLTPRTKSNRRVGYDLTFSVPKTLSVLYVVTGDTRILKAFRTAIAKVMREIERSVQTRIRVNGQSTDRVTGNLLYAEFVHFTSRPVDGVPDPHLHAHCFTFNLTYDTVEERFKAMQFGAIKERAPYFEALFHSELARELRYLGFAIEVGPKGWELAGMPAGTVERFSRRTAEIEEVAARRGITNAAQKAKLGAITRRSKEEALSQDAIRSDWLRRLTVDELRQIRSLPAGDRGRETGGVEAPSPAYPGWMGPQIAAAAAVRHAVDRSLRHSALAPEWAFVATALRHNPGACDLAAIEAEYINHGVIPRELNGRRYVTTKRAIDEERMLVERLRAAQGALTLVEGVGGTGKTLGAFGTSKHIDHTRKVIALGTTAASREALEKAGFKDPTTVSRFLVDRSLRRGAAMATIWVDHATELTMRQANLLLKHAGRYRCDLVWGYDVNFLGSPMRGSPVRIARREPSVPTVYLDELRRPKGELARALTALKEGSVSGLKELKDKGYIHQSSRADLVADAAFKWVFSSERDSTMVLAATEALAKETTKEIRRHLLARGDIRRQRNHTQLVAVPGSPDDRANADFYKPGQIVQFSRAWVGFRSGSRWKVIGRNALGHVLVRSGLTFKALPLKRSDRFQVFEQRRMNIAVGDMVRLTRGVRAQSQVARVIASVTHGRIKPTRHLHAGVCHRITGFTLSGDIKLSNGSILPRDFGHITHGYCQTIRAAVGLNADHVILIHPADDKRPQAAGWLFSGLSRGTKSTQIFTDDTKALFEQVARDLERRAVRSAGAVRTPAAELEPRRPHGDHHRDR